MLNFNVDEELREEITGVRTRHRLNHTAVRQEAEQNTQNDNELEEEQCD